MKILVIEDEAIIRKDFVHALRQAGHEVEQAQDGGVALAYLDRAFDLLVIDIVTPRMSGLEFLAEARKRGVKCPAIVVTAYDRSNCDGIEGIWAVICKPITSDELVALVGAKHEPRRAETPGGGPAGERSGLPAGGDGG